MPSLSAAFATSTPIAPRPTTPSVRFGSSKPTNCFLPDSTALSSSSPEPFSVAHVVERLRQIARRHQKPRDDELLDGVRVRARRVEHRHAELAQLRDGNVVRARARPADREQRVGQRHVVHLERAQQDRVGAADLGRDLVAIARQPVEARHGDAVQRADLEGRHRAHPCRFAKSAMNAIERVDARFRHRVVQARAHAADDAVALQVREAGGLRLLRGTACRAPDRRA